MDADLYRRSSQYRTWSFTHDGLRQARVQANRKIIPSEYSLSPDEELVLVTYFAVDRMGAFAEVFRFPSQVKATAIAFFRRFYLVHSVMEYDPRLVLPTAVFLAAKAENYFIPIDQFVEPLDKIEKSSILELEFTLFKALSFTLTVHNALKPLHGFFLDMQGANPSGDDMQKLGRIHDDAKAVILSALSSDVCFLHTPSQIALAAMMEVDEPTVTEYMSGLMDGPNSGLDRLFSIVNECRTYLSTPAIPTKEQAKPILKKLKEYLASQTTAAATEGPATKKIRV